MTTNDELQALSDSVRPELISSLLTNARSGMNVKGDQILEVAKATAAVGTRADALPLLTTILHRYEELRNLTGNEDWREIVPALMALRVLRDGFGLGPNRPAFDQNE